MAGKEVVGGVTTATPTLVPVRQDEIRVLPQPLVFLKNLCYGGVAGFAGSLLTFPLDLAKGRVQVSVSSNAAGGKPAYTGILDCLRKTAQADGIRGLYKGLPVQAIGIIPEKALKLSLNDLGRYYLRDEKSGGISRVNEALAGAFAGTGQVVVTSPAEMLKIRMQLQTTLPVEQRQSFSQVVKSILSGGIRGVYKGAGATLLRDVPFTAVYFPFFSYLKLCCARSDISWLRRDNTDHLVNADKRVSLFGTFLAGLVAGSVVAVAVTPADVIKTRVQGQNGDALYQGKISKCVQSILKTEGVGAFFKGASARFMLIGPLFGVVLFTYELMPRIIKF